MSSNNTIFRRLEALASKADVSATAEEHKIGYRVGWSEGVCRASEEIHHDVMKLVEFIEGLGKQKLFYEMTGSEYRDADFDCAYEHIIELARERLKDLSNGARGETT